MREIRLYGHLGQTFGRVFKLNVQSPAEALRALRANFPTFEAYLNKHSKQGFQVFVGKESVGVDGLHMRSDDSVIKFIPVVSGAGHGVGTIIIGALIIIAAFMSDGASLSATGTLTATTAGGMALSFGASLIIGGVTQLLSKSLGLDSSESAINTPSYVFNGPVNTVAQGNPVPICYGEMIVGSQVISAGLTVEQNYVVQPAYAPPAAWVAYQPTPWD